MSYQVELTSGAFREYKRLPSIAQQRIASQIDLLEIDPYVLSIKKLSTPLHGFRLRVGEYRILFAIEGNSVTIYSIAHRKEAYR